MNGSVLRAPCSVLAREDCALEHPHNHQREDDHFHRRVRPRLNSAEGKRRQQDQEEKTESEDAVAGLGHGSGGIISDCELRILLPKNYPNILCDVNSDTAESSCGAYRNYGLRIFIGEEPNVLNCEILDPNAAESSGEIRISNWPDATTLRCSI
jgi:hypothetical protein